MPYIILTDLRYMFLNFNRLIQKPGILFSYVNISYTFISITSKLSNTVELVEKSTILYEDTASKLNQWVVNEYEFKQGVEILINKLEEFKDFNSGVWESYRKEMQTAVNIIKDTTSTLSDNVENLDAEFYERLSNTLENLDSYIVTLIEREKDE